MYNLFIVGWSLNEVAQATCWTLVHSLWQGVAVAIVAGLIIVATRRSSAALRYNLLAALFIFFLVTVAITFLKEFSKFSDQGESLIADSGSLQHSNLQALTDGRPGLASSSPGSLQQVISYLNDHAGFIVLAWFAFFLSGLIKMMANVLYGRRIRQHKILEPPAHWKGKLKELSVRLGIGQTIALLESSLVKAPVVLGYLKPVILMPVGLLANLPPSQIEAVLVHELAHILRKDYLVNLLQIFAEAIFFFNPALMWLSSLIREERENCCDDIVIAHTNDRTQFIHALVAFQEFTLDKSPYGTTIAFAGRKNYLLNRVRRIIYNENKKLNAMEKGIIIFSIVVIGLVGFASVRQTEKHKTAVFPRASVTASIQDTAPVKKKREPVQTAPLEFKSLNSILSKDSNSQTRTITAEGKDGKRYKLVMRNRDAMQLYINDERIPEEQLDQYREIVAVLQEAAELKGPDRVNGEMSREKHEEMNQLEEQKMKQLEAERMELMERLSAVDAERNELAEKHGDDLSSLDDKSREFLMDLKSRLLEKDQYNKDMGLFKERRDLLDEKLAPESFLEKKLLFDRLTDLKKDMVDQNANERNEFNEKNQVLFEKLNGLQRDNNQKFELLKDKLVLEDGSFGAYIGPVLEELLAQKIITSSDGDVSFDLNSKSFSVNGKKQPAEVTEKFQKKYLKKEGDYIKYSKQQGHTNISTNLN